MRADIGRLMWVRFERRTLRIGLGSGLGRRREIRGGSRGGRRENLLGWKLVVLMAWICREGYRRVGSLGKVSKVDIYG